MASLSEQQVFFSVNLVFSGLTGPRSAADFAFFEHYFPAMESRNGQMQSGSNRASADYARRLGKAEVAGSDAHTLSSAGTTYTEIAGVRDQGEFLQALRQGRGGACGEAGDYPELTPAGLEKPGGLRGGGPGT